MWRSSEDDLQAYLDAAYHETAERIAAGDAVEKADQGRRLNWAIKRSESGPARAEQTSDSWPRTYTVDSIG